VSTLLAFLLGLLKLIGGAIVGGNKPTQQDAVVSKELKDDLDAQIADLPPLPDDAP
jgi:hypothetical protein